MLAALILIGCGDETLPNNNTGGAGGTTGSGGSGGQGGVVVAPFQVRGSVEQVHVWKATPATKIELRDANDAVVQSATTDAQGSYVFRKVTPGKGYAVRVAEDTVSPIEVKSVAASQPPQSFYDGQEIKPGYNYITTRDGTTLAAYVTLPGKLADGPYPTIVDYSGYDPAKPGGPLGDYQAFCSTIPALCDAPNDPSALIAAVMGYATVSVNMRGTGCSGGAYDYFEELQILDGYDVIETIAAQSWVKGHRVGMTGLSYPGITQLFVARSNPPSLAAITPFSVIGSSYTTGRPGGIFNDGFALEWITNVLDRAGPYAQGWEQDRVDAGDTTCADNQLLHSQKVDVIQELSDNAYYSDELVKPVDPTAFVDQIKMPVFLAASFQDEQTGPYFFTLLDRFKSSPLTRFTVYNGVHPDAFAPQVLVEWKAFLDIYVAHDVPKVPDDVRTLAPALFQPFFQVTLNIPPDRFSKYATWEEAKAAYEAEQPLRVIFEDGGGDTPGAPEGTFDARFDAWPVPGTEARRFYFQADGSLADTPPAETTGASSWDLDPDAGHRGIMAPGGNVWDPLPDYDWKQPAAGSAAIFESAPLTEDLVMVGTGSVDLWIRSPVDDADVEVNLIDVRPDGQERYIQSGWLRASVRKLSDKSTALWPDPTYRAEDVAPLVPGEWTPARVGIAGFAHVFRTGSRVRVSVDTPGDSRARWQFALKTFPTAVTYDVAHNAAMPSSVVLPVIPNMTASTPLPDCPSLRGQQCRTYMPYTNVASAP